MKIIGIQILLFCLIPVGIFMLIKAIKLLSKAFNGSILLEIPFTTKSAGFEIHQEGSYAIWQKGQVFSKTPVGEFKPEIRDVFTQNKIALRPSLLRPSSNSGRSARMELYTFSAPAGKYTLTLVEGASISRLEHAVSDLLPGRPADPDQYFIQIRESLPLYLKLVAIPFILLSAGLIIGGLVAGLLAKQLIAHFNIPV